MSISSVATERSSGGKWKWCICGILFMATVLCYLDRQTLAVLAPQIKAEFQLNNQQWGEMLAAFRGTYALIHIPAGWLVDRFSVRYMYAFAVGLWSIAGAAAAFCQKPTGLIWSRRVLGIGEAFNWPAALRVTANILPPEDRGLANGIFTSGAAVGAILAPILIIPIAQYTSWRAAFFIVGLLGAAWIAIWLLATRNAPILSTGIASADALTANVQSKPPLHRRLITIFKNPAFWLLMVVAGTLNPCAYFIADWIPLYMHDQRGFGLLTAAFVATPMFLAQDVGAISGGAIVKILTARGWSLRLARGTTISIGVGLVLSASAAGYVQNSYVCIGLLIAAACGIALVTTNYLAAAQEVSFSNVGLVAGILGAFGNLVAWYLNPCIGRHVDETGNYHLIFVILALLALTGLLAMFAFDLLGSRRKKAARNNQSAAAEE